MGPSQLSYNLLRCSQRREQNVNLLKVSPCILPLTMYRPQILHCLESNYKHLKQEVRSVGIVYLFIISYNIILILVLPKWLIVSYFHLL